jgi:hypothetical protein
MPASYKAVRVARDLLAVLKYTALNLYFRSYIGSFTFASIKQKISSSDGPPAPPELARWVGRLVTVSARYVPHSTCLSRAMAAQFVLKRKGFGSTVCIGVANGDGPEAMLAHAWLVSGESVVVGNENNELEKFKLLTQMKGQGR